MGMLRLSSVPDKEVLLMLVRWESCIKSPYRFPSLCCRLGPPSPSEATKCAHSTLLDGEHRFCTRSRSVEPFAWV